MKRRGTIEDAGSTPASSTMSAWPPNLPLTPMGAK